MNKSLLVSLPIALRSLRQHGGRTALTMLGIVIGIAAVIIVMSAGQSIQSLVLGQVEAFGSNTIQIEPKVPTTAKNSSDNATTMAQGVQITTLTLADAEAIKALPNVERYSAGLMGQAVASYLGENTSLNYIGTSPDFIDIDQSEIAVGRFYSASDDNQLARVIVLGSGVAEDLFGNREAVGESIRLGRHKFQVIGVLASRGSGFGISFDDMAYIPIQTAQRLMLGVDHVAWITAQVADPDRQDQTASEVIDLLRDRHDIEDPADDDFGVTTLAEMRELIDTVLGGMTLLLMAVAAISLVVGGVGIMNIMYVAVTERTFEIGLRKAIGARRQEILWQFLWEAIGVTLIGGLVGALVGTALTALVSTIATALGFTWAFTLPISAVLIAVGFCAMIGLVFGFYPARRAAGLDPITALRVEQ